jgi:hypothetical protein
MPNLKVSSLAAPLLDIASYARRGPGRRDRISAAEVAQISRTVRRVPEVVMRVHGSASLSRVREHIRYISRRGELALEMDDGERLSGKGVAQRLVEEWDLDLDEPRRQSRLSATMGWRPPRLVHTVVFSMPPGTPPAPLLAAARSFLREEFASRHRYLFVLHTDKPHPHVHAVVKAVSEQGVRLETGRAVLRRWRHEFARHLRVQGIEANATERAVRGQSRRRKLDGIYRAARHGTSTHLRERAETVARELSRGRLELEPGKSTLVRTRAEVVRGWAAARDLLVHAGQLELAAQVDRFIQQMPPPHTEKELIAEALLQHARKPLDRSPPAKVYARVK